MLERDPQGTTDAQVWAEEFCRLFGLTEREADMEVEDDVGLMAAWFATAIETGREAGRSAERERAAPLVEFAEYVAGHFRFSPDAQERARAALAAYREGGER